MAGQLTTEVEQLVNRHRDSGIALDTNLLLLWVVGSTDPKLIEQHKRTDGFTVQDFELLRQIVERCSRGWTTPNVLTETVDLLMQTDDRRQGRVLRAFAAEVARIRESYYQSIELLAAPHFSVLGLADTSLLRAAQRGRLIVSVDFKLCGLMSSRGWSAINFNHIRRYR